MYAIVRRLLFLGERETFSAPDTTGPFVIVDIHTHPWNSHLQREKPILSRTTAKDVRRFVDLSDRLVQKMDRLGIDVSVVLASIDLPDELLHKIVQKYPDRLVGFTYGYPSLDPETTHKELEALDRAVKDLGFKGIKLIPLFQGLPFDSPALRPILEKACELRVPIMLDCWPITDLGPVTADPRFQGLAAYDTITSDYQNLFRFTSSTLMDRLPNLNIIAAHAGGGALLFPDVIGRKKMEQIYFDTAAIRSTHGLKRIEMGVNMIGAEKILFGSDDWIENCPCTQEIMLEAIRRLDLNQEQEAAILGQNAQRLLGL